MVHGEMSKDDRIAVQKRKYIRNQSTLHEKASVMSMEGRYLTVQPRQA